MHILITSDQHVDSFGGAQVSMRLQRAALEAAGHTVTLVMPASGAHPSGDPAYIEVPAVPITRDREYAAFWPGGRADRTVAAALHSRPPVDLVHIQADFWGNALGQRLAERLEVPRVVTLHNRVDVGLSALAPTLGGLALTMLNGLLTRALRPGPGSHVLGRDARSYFRRLVAGAAAITAPSGHFAARLVRDGIADEVRPVWNGIADELLAEVRAVSAMQPARPASAPPQLVWLGRFSPEKRLLPFLRAVVAAGLDVEILVLGGGDLETEARAEAAKAGPGTVIRFEGRVSYREALHRIARADAVVQTSIGFETQGMTVFEAAALGVPAIVSDPDIAGELGACWRVPAPEERADGDLEAARVEMLAATLGAAVEQLRSGRGITPDAAVGERFRQSAATAAMIEVYESALAAGAPAPGGASSP